MDDAMEQAKSEAFKIEYMSVTLNQLVTPGSGGRLYSMHHALNMVLRIYEDRKSVVDPEDVQCQ